MRRLFAPVVFAVALAGTATAGPLADAAAHAVSAYCAPVISRGEMVSPDDLAAAGYTPENGGQPMVSGNIGYVRDFGDGQRIGVYRNQQARTCQVHVFGPAEIGGEYVDWLQGSGWTSQFEHEAASGAVLSTWQGRLDNTRTQQSLFVRRAGEIGEDNPRLTIMLRRAR